VALTSLRGTARAASEQQDPCFEAAVDGQRARRAGKLLYARSRFSVCAQQECPTVVRDRCTGWLSETNASVPSIVVAAQDDEGRDLVDAQVDVDGVGMKDAVGGRAIDLEPGAHRVRVTRDGKIPVDATVVVREGEKERRIVAVLKPLDNARR